MGEYGRTVGQSSGVGGGGGGASLDVGVDVMQLLQDIIEGIAALPPEMLVVIVAAVMVGGFVMTWRTS